MNIFRTNFSKKKVSAKNLVNIFLRKKLQNMPLK